VYSVEGCGQVARICALHLRTVATRSPSVGRWTSETRIGIEAASRSQTDEDLAHNSLQPLLHLDGIVASVEDEQGSDPLLLRREAQKRFDLLGGYLVGVLRRAHALHVEGGAPALADEVEPGDEPVGPSSHDGLASRVARRMVVVSALGAALRVAAIPHAHVHRVDGRCCFASSKRITCEQSPQSFSIDPSSIQCGVKAAPAATMRRLEAQMNGRRNAIRSEESVGELEESIGPAVETFLERAAEGAKSIGRSHDATIMHSPTALRILCLPAGLKRKFREKVGRGSQKPHIIMVGRGRCLDHRFWCIRLRSVSFLLARKWLKSSPRSSLQTVRAHSRTVLSTRCSSSKRPCKRPTLCRTSRNVLRSSSADSLLIFRLLRFRYGG
jgi:hypothetical protein